MQIINTDKFRLVYLPDTNNAYVIFDDLLPKTFMSGSTPSNMNGLLDAFAASSKGNAATRRTTSIIDLIYRSIANAPIVTAGMKGADVSKFQRMKIALSHITDYRIIRQYVFSDALAICTMPEIIARYDDELVMIDFTVDFAERHESAKDLFYQKRACAALCYMNMSGEYISKSVVINGTDMFPQTFVTDLTPYFDKIPTTVAKAVLPTK